MLVIDSDVLIDLLRQEPAAMRFLADLRERGETLAITSINIGEVLRGLQGTPDRLAKTRRVLELLVEVPIGPRAARRFGELMHTLDRLGGPVPAIDGFVAAATLEEGAKLVTRNVTTTSGSPGCRS